MRLAACVTLAVAATLATTASAVRKPTEPESRAIEEAVQITFGCSGCRWRASDVRVSTADRRFAAARARGTRNGNPLQGATVLLWRGLSKWAVISYASDHGELGCGYVTRAVRRDLFGPYVLPCTE